MNQTQSATTAPARRSTPRDIRLLAILALVALVAGIALFVSGLPKTEETLAQGQRPAAGHDFRRESSATSAAVPEKTQERVWKAQELWIDPAVDPDAHQRQAQQMEADQRFQQAVAMLHAKRFDEALTALGRVLQLVPNNTDVYTNMGYALLGLKEYQTAFHTFEKAMDINPAQANAYYGAAMALEGMGDLEGALGGMRSFLHLSQDKSAAQIHVARARSAIWEWQAKLGRGPWGPSKGIPPGFTKEELKRNDMGVGIKIPLPETADENGVMQYEIKYSDKFELFDR
tara:strand:- start:8491 stop:9351 length:861 start_codon:yes stop_codon:yes gene_type:complete